MSRIGCFNCPDGVAGRCDGCNIYESSHNPQLDIDEYENQINFKDFVCRFENIAEHIYNDEGVTKGLYIPIDIWCDITKL